MDRKPEGAPRPLISVCVATYNQAGYIADCVASVLAQEGPFELEVLVGDDASTDATREVLAAFGERHDARLRIHRHEPNVGGCRNYQWLIERARGEFIAHLDGDDFWLPGKLRAQLQFLQDHPGASAVYANAVVVAADSSPLGFFNNPQPELFDARYLLGRGNFLHHGSLMYRAATRQLVLGIDRTYLDYRHHLRLALAGSLGYVNQVLSGYRSGVGNSITTRDPDAVASIYWEALEDATSRADLADAIRSSLAHLLADGLLDSLRRADLGRCAHWLAWRRSLPEAWRAGLVGRTLRVAARKLLRLLARGGLARRRAARVAALFER
jgi:glycosyltransferase involved in cell wall biosynthesis